MRSLTLEKLKNKVARRSSEPSIFEFSSATNAGRRNSMSGQLVVVSDADSAKPRTVNSRIRASSLSLMPPNSRSRLKSVTKKQAKELIRQETSQVILKKLDHVLSDLGLQLPIPLNTTSATGGPLKLMKIYVSNSNDCIYLAPASSASFTYEDVENGGNDTNLSGREGSNWFAQNENNSLDSGSDHTGVMSDTDDEQVLQDATRNQLRSKMESFRLPNYLCTQIDSESPIPHLFAVIVDLKKECQVKSVRIEFQSAVSTLWPTGEPQNRYNYREKYKIGSLEWIVSMHDADYFISITNSNDTKYKNITPDQLAKRARKYKLVNIRQLADGTDDVNLGRRNPLYLSEFLQRAKSDATPNNSENAHDTFKAGIYVFLIPILIPPHIPASVTSVNGSLNHRLTVQVSKISDMFNRRTTVSSLYSLPMVRTPPSLANSIADKPIYVNRVWNNALHYVITFPRKYVSLGSEHTINLKLVPLVKDVIIKRIKFNVLERITYVSHDLSKEYECDGEDPFLTKVTPSGKNRERVIPVCELKTKHKSFNGNIEPFKEEVIKCPDNNILYSCYEPNETKGSQSEEPSVMIASPLDINIALPFLTTRADKEMMTSNLDEPGDLDLKGGFANSSRRASSYTTSTRGDSVLGLLCPSSPIIGSLETHISHMNGELLMRGMLDEDVLALDSSYMCPDDYTSGTKESISQGYTSTARALAPDSNFRHIQISHRLQVCFRISKPDPADNFRMHHYEVVVDTPLILLSAKCNDESIQLPQYNELDSQFPQTPVQREISFRTPTYSKNGVSIKCLDEYGDEQLPSFEEAISATASPMMRSVSLGENRISRVASLAPSDPAPAYERSPSKSDDVIPPLNIDDLVIEPSPTAVPRRRSVFKTSLLSSFAPSTNTLNRPDNTTISPNSSSSKSVISQMTPPEREAASFDASPSIGSLVSMLSCSAPTTTSTGVLTRALESGSDDLTHLYTGRPMEPQSDNSLEIQSHASEEELGLTTNVPDDLESIFTQESQFVQKLPLLQNVSFDNIHNETGYTNRTTEDLIKMLTDTLSGVMQCQNMSHAA